MNATISAVCDRIAGHAGTLLGARWGFAGLADGDLRPIETLEARTHRAEAGTWLGSSRWPGLLEPDGPVACARSLLGLDIQGLIVLGGNGSLLGAQRIAEHFSPVVFVPCTIDDDIPGTRTTIGLDSAVDYAVDVIERLRCTGRSLPGRGFLVQTLGGSNGRLAGAVARAAGVDDLIVPEHPVELQCVADRFRRLASEGTAIAVMCEGVSDGVSVAGELARLSGVRVHPTILGHAQRAATPTEVDQGLSKQAAELAVEQVISAESCRLDLQVELPALSIPLTQSLERQPEPLASAQPLGGTSHEPVR